ncbi:MAG: hypothetical protein ACOYKA_04965, partial [Legionellaceae bacterium]
EGAEYLYHGLVDNFKFNKILKQCEPLLKGVWNFFKSVELKDTELSDIWGGVSPSSPSENQYLKTAQTALLQTSSTEARSMRVDVAFSIDEQDKFNRGYVQDGKELDDKTRDKLDNYIHAWLLHHNLARVDGKIYKFNEDTSAYDEPMPPDALARLINDETQGFGAYIERETKGAIVASSVQVKRPSDAKTLERGGGGA